jgi:hypothetical protein
MFSTKHWHMPLLLRSGSDVKTGATRIPLRPRHHSLPSKHGVGLHRQHNRGAGGSFHVDSKDSRNEPAPKGIGGPPISNVRDVPFGRRRMTAPLQPRIRFGTSVQRITLDTRLANRFAGVFVRRQVQRQDDRRTESSERFERSGGAE